MAGMVVGNLVAEDGLAGAWRALNDVGAGPNRPPPRIVSRPSMPLATRSRPLVMVLTLFSATSPSGSTTVNVEPTACVLDRHHSAQRLGELAHDPKTDAEASAARAAHRHQPLERREDPGLVLGRDADTVVADRQAGQGAVGTERHHDRLASTVLEGVGEQVVQDLIKGHLVEQTNNSVLDGGGIQPRTDEGGHGLVPLDGFHDQPR